MAIEIIYEDKKEESVLEWLLTRKRIDVQTVIAFIIAVFSWRLFFIIFMPHTLEGRTPIRTEPPIWPWC